MLEGQIKMEEMFPINAVDFNFLFICESWKIDNTQKCFLSSKSAYYYDF